MRQKNIAFLLIISIALSVQSISYCAEVKKSAENVNQELFSLINDAIQTRDLDLHKIRDYLEKGADPSYFPRENNKGDNTSLSEYVFVSAHKIEDGIITEEDGNETLKLFFEKGAKIRSADYRLIIPSIDKLNLYLRVFLDNGLDPNRRVEGKTLVDRIIQAQNFVGIKILKEYGVALPNEKEISRLLFFQAIFDKDIRNIEKLLKEGVYIDEKDSEGQTPLMYAIKCGVFFTDKDAETIMCLLKNGADVNQQANAELYHREDLAAPLHVAVYWSSICLNKEIKNPRLKDSPQNAKKVLDALLKKGAFVSDSASDGKTPLHIAAERDNLYAAKLLIKWGAKKSVEDIKGKTPFDYAKSTKMIKLLNKSDKFSFILITLIFFIIAIILFACLIFWKLKTLKKKDKD
jgi:hypothetical protein